MRIRGLVLSAKIMGTQLDAYHSKAKQKQKQKVKATSDMFDDMRVSEESSLQRACETRIAPTEITLNNKPHGSRRRRR